MGNQHEKKKMVISVSWKKSIIELVRSLRKEHMQQQDVMKLGNKGHLKRPPRFFFFKRVCDKMRRKY